jgi:hypothetical protein
MLPSEGPSRDAYAAAYARQARSDFALYELLTRLNDIAAKSKRHADQGNQARQLPTELHGLLEQIGEWRAESCHALHYLQMACEKIAKAYRFRDSETAERRLLTEHVAFSQFIESFYAAPAMKRQYAGRESQLRSQRKLAANLAREIERLAPAVDREAFPVNTEYPWADGKVVVVPCEYTFPSLSLLRDGGGRSFLKVLTVAMTDFEELHIHA